MNLKSITVVAFVVIFSVTCSSQPTKQGSKGKNNRKISFVKHESEKRIDVMVDGKLFTSYRWNDSVLLKPVLYPVMTSAGTEVTRGYPINPRPGERVDHPHQIGVCYSYGNVNGFDFWNNSTAIPAEKKGGYGTTKHVSVDKLSGGNGEGSMLTTESWVDPSGKELLAEKSEYHFIAKGSTRIIERITTLAATGKDVSMKDTKEGGFGIRVARQLELPSQEELILTDAKGNPTPVKKMSNEGVTGNYRSSEGITGDAVYGTRGKWVDLYGKIGDEKISVVMIDHPKNPGYPTYWHARGYGLLLDNSLGAGAYSGGKNVMNFSISSGKSATFRFRLVIYSGADLTDAEINAYAEDFAKKY